MDARSNEPDAALNALQDLEEQVQAMSAGDDQLSASLAAIASALAGDQSTQALADAINTGDMRHIAQAVQGMSPQDRQRVALVMQDAANRAGRVSQSVGNQLQQTANGLQAAAQ